MSFNSFNLEAPPATPFNKPGPPTPSPYNFLTHSALDSYCFKTPLRTSTNPSTPIPSHNRASKRRNENSPLGDVLPSPNRAEPPSKKRKTTRDKLDAIFLAIHKEKLTFGEFIYLASCHKDKNNQPLQRSQTHATSISSFLQGKTSHTPTMIVQCWYQSTDGRASVSGSIPLFSTSPVYSEIKPARAGLTAFAAQIVERELVREAREVVKPTSGLHATSKKRGSHQLEWVDIGASTVSQVAEIYKDVQVSVPFPVSFSPPLDPSFYSFGHTPCTGDIAAIGVANKV
ncbi:hypothetical protein BYT27DRAFT_7186656 [Phlegmacium glaucopus]|nr:hypothetical protein BYT27DRAFT_7186656 [Phlegmacium glaucopus]